VTPPDYEYLRKVLKDLSGLDLSADKQYLIESRLLPLARRAGMSDIGELVQKMKGGSSALINQVVEAMTTNETLPSSATRCRSITFATPSCPSCCAHAPRARASGSGAQRVPRDRSRARLRCA